jgi:hypothetical protein
MAGAILDIRPRVLQTPETVRYEFELDYSSSSRTETVFYEFARELAPTPPDNFDGILCATVLHAMAEGRDIHLHGPATSTMLLNLAEFQRAWSRWLPTVYRPVKIEVESEIHNPQQGTSRAISAFSGGVDSSFTLLRNSTPAADPGYAVDTVLLVHGFDVSLSNWGDLKELIERTAPIRELTGVQLRIVRTNSKELALQKWEYSFAAQLAACMHMYSAEFSLALVGSSEPYDALVLPWGSNPVTDHLLSGGRLRIVHDGAAFSRTDKIAYVSGFPAALQSLKVCWEGKRQGRNCGTCEKCVRTQLNFLAVAVVNPPCFDAPLELRRITDIRLKSDASLAELRSIVDYAERRSVDEDWVRMLRKRVRRGLRNWTMRDKLRCVLERAGLLETVRRLRRVFAPRPVRGHR